VIAAKLEETREEIINISPDVVVLTATGDIADERFVNAFINSVIAETGRIDYAVCPCSLSTLECSSRFSYITRYLG
jgi:NAD(P)-dependent dehydrogenase (short-subunit alcohol dehydrogenase family)